MESCRGKYPPVIIKRKDDVQDTFREEYKPLNERAKNDMLRVKQQAKVLLNSMNAAVDPNERSERSRCMAIARTNLEQAIMWAVKGITSV